MTGSPTLRGFVLQPTYRVEEGRPVVHLYGRLEDGRAFLVRDGRQVPHFYVEVRDASRARERGARRQVPSERSTFSGAPVVRVEVPTPSDTPPLRDRLSRAGIRTHEADVRFAMRYLIDRGIRGSIEIRSEGRDAAGVPSSSKIPTSRPRTGRLGSTSSPSTSRPTRGRGSSSRSRFTGAASPRCAS